MEQSYRKAVRVDEYGYRFEVRGARGICKISIPAEKLVPLCNKLLRIENTFGPILIGSVHFNIDTGEPISFMLMIENLRADLREKVARVLHEDGAILIAFG